MKIESKSVDGQYSTDGSSANFLTIGRGSYLFDFSVNNFGFESHILLGRFCSVAEGCFFLIGGNHNYKNVTMFPFDMKKMVADILGADAEPLPFNRPNHFQVIIGHDVWIGQNVTIMGGVKIGNGAIIGANAVVAKDIPPYSIAVGNLARVIKYRFDAETIKKFLAVKWWNWSLKKIADNLPLMTDVEKFLERHYSPVLDEFIQKSNNFEGGGAKNLSVYCRLQCNSAVVDKNSA